MPTRHLIGRLTVDVPAQRVSEGQARQQEVSSWLRSESLWQRIAQILDQLVPPDQVLTIPRLEITVEAGNEGAFERALGESLQKAVAQFLRQQGAQTDTLQPVEQHLAQLVWHFLETGSLPWLTIPTQRADVANWLNALADGGHDDFVQALRQRVGLRPAIWLRLVYAFGIEKARRLVLHYGHFSPTETQWLTQTADAVEESQGSASLPAFWREALIYSALSAENPALFRQMIASVTHPVSAKNEAVRLTDRDHTASSSDEPEAGGSDPERNPFFVQNAGLVLLGQFLPTLFTRLDLLDGSDFRDQEARFKAVHLLQYLVTGELETYEYDLTLNKILCHVPLSAPVPRWVQLTETDLAEADQLLRAAISHWEVLKNTSVAGLRETFLQREGQLTQPETGGWRLRVERKTVDILLDRLPMGWGYSVVSLPWMPHLLFVEW